MASQLLSLLDTGNKNAFTWNTGKKIPLQQRQDQEKSVLIELHYLSSSMTDNSYQGLQERKWKSRNTPAFLNMPNYDPDFRDWKLKWQHLATACICGTKDSSKKLTSSKKVELEGSDVKTKQENWGGKKKRKEEENNQK